MTTTAELLVELNGIRVTNGMKPLKAWKESRAKLEAAIAYFEAPTVAREPEQVTDDAITPSRAAVILGKDPKEVRAKLRRMGYKAPYTITSDVMNKLTADLRRK